jgi:hypothetical protein
LQVSPAVHACPRLTYTSPARSTPCTMAVAIWPAPKKPTVSGPCVAAIVLLVVYVCEV